MRGGEQWDLLHGGPGHDRLHGGLHDDSLYGGAGDDRLVGDEARAVQRPQVDEQGVVTGAGADALSGGDGADRLIGRAASDSLSGGPGDDRLAAGAGGDVLQGGAGSDSLSCGSGADQVRPPAAEELLTSACEFIRFDWQTLETLMSLGFSPYPRATSAGSATFALGCPAHDEDGVSVHYPCAGTLVLREAGTRRLLGEGRFSRRGAYTTTRFDVHVRLTVLGRRRAQRPPGVLATALLSGWDNGWQRPRRLPRMAWTIRLRTGE